MVKRLVKNCRKNIIETPQNDAAENAGFAPPKMSTSENVMHSGVCRCCLSVGYHRDFTLSYQPCKGDAHNTECYSDMFFDCYKFPLHLDNGTPLICLDCIKKLKTAFELKKNVQDSTKHFSLTSANTKYLVELSPNVDDNAKKANIEKEGATLNTGDNKVIHEIKVNERKTKEQGFTDDVIDLTIMSTDNQLSKNKMKDLIGQLEIQDPTTNDLATSNNNHVRTDLNPNDAREINEVLLNEQNVSEDTILKGAELDKEVPSDMNIIEVDANHQESLTPNNSVAFKMVPVSHCSFLHIQSEREISSDKYLLPKEKVFTQPKKKRGKAKKRKEKNIKLGRKSTKLLNSSINESNNSKMAISNLSKPKQIHSYTSKTRCLNKIQVGEPVTINSAEFESLSKDIVENPTSKTISNSISSINTQEINTVVNIFNDIDYNPDNSRFTQVQTQLKNEKVGFISFSRDLELDHLPPMKYTDPKAMDALNEQGQPNGIAVDLCKENHANGKDIGVTCDNSEELQAYRERLLSGFVKKPTVIINRIEYEKKMKELSTRLPTAAYRCKSCCAVFVAESALVDHKKTHLEADRRQQVEGNGVAASNTQAKRTLTAAPGVKVVNQMYKTSSKGFLMIYASGNCFCKSSTSEDGRVLWVCKTHHQCPATLHTKGNEIVNYNDSHTPRTNYTPAKRPRPSRAKIRVLNEEKESSTKTVKLNEDTIKTKSTKTVDKDSNKTNKDGNRSSKQSKEKGQSKQGKEKSNKVESDKIEGNNNGLGFTSGEEGTDISAKLKTCKNSGEQSNSATLKGYFHYVKKSINKDLPSVRSERSSSSPILRLRREHTVTPKQYLPSPSKKRLLPTISMTQDQKQSNIKQNCQKRTRMDNDSEYSFVMDDKTVEYFDAIFEDL